MKSSHSSRKISKRKLETDCNIRLWCARLAEVMGVMASISFLIGQPFANGLTLCVSAIVLMSMALGYRHMELVWNALKVRLRR
jgi:Mn2+/Fe2+ NRAMP family transporter